jgi:PIN domain nuclease of toxin-antitoxin system
LNLLLDTCAVIFIAQDPNRLSKPTRDLVVDAANAVFVSVVAGGELACLADRKKVILPQHWKAWFRDCIERNGWNLLPLTIDIMEEAYSLPDPIHRDPVDRILIATSRTEEMTLVTTDRLILEYPHVAARG